MDLSKLRREFLNDIKKVKTLFDLEKLRIKYLGRKGELTRVFDFLKALSQEKRKEMGREANKLKIYLENEFKENLQKFKNTSAEPRQRIDITAPGVKIPRGHLHPLTLIRRKAEEIFSGMGFEIIEGPEVESDYYNFQALNIPKDHPARDLQSTFFIKSKLQNPNSKLLLRTQTSPVQIRYMESHQPPIRIISPGRVFRYEATDASHEIQFHQLEGLMVDKEINLSNLKGILEMFFKKIFGEQVEIQFRPSYFPFVEPGVEVDLKWRGQWLEVAGAGMVHPKVFQAVKYIPAENQGLAFGLGLDRLAMIKYHIDDIRLFYSSDLRFLKQF